MLIDFPIPVKQETEPGRNFVSADDVVHKTAENWRVEGQILARGQCKGLRAYSQWPFRGKNRRRADGQTTALHHLRRGETW